MTCNTLLWQIVALCGRFDGPIYIFFNLSNFKYTKHTRSNAVPSRLVILGSETKYFLQASNTIGFYFITIHIPPFSDICLWNASWKGLYLHFTQWKQIHNAEFACGPMGSVNNLLSRLYRKFHSSYSPSRSTFLLLLFICHLLRLAEGG